MDSAKTIEYLESIVISQEYLAQAARDELVRLREKPEADLATVMRASALIHAHAGINDQAIAQLNALVGEDGGKKPELLNKLAQVRLRRQSEGDIAGATAAASRVLELDHVSDGERWFAHQNLALAHWAGGDRENALSHAEEAISLIDDPRTRAILIQLGKDVQPGDLRRYFPDTNLEPGLLDDAALASIGSRMEPFP
ncbi:MAG: hypothetical protein K2X00_21685 [Nitrospiraceae bacterium]|nr:hypothetical protein [Nitrospiraceae bacterium]